MRRCKTCKTGVHWNPVARGWMHDEKDRALLNCGVVMAEEETEES